MARTEKCPPGCEECPERFDCLDAGPSGSIPERVRFDSAVYAANNPGPLATMMEQGPGMIHYLGGPSPQERYRRDASFRALVDMMTAHIYQCRFTPSEMREAAVLACIRYESTRPSNSILNSPLLALVNCYRDKFQTATFMGHKMEEMTREELMAAVIHISAKDKPHS